MALLTSQKEPEGSSVKVRNLKHGAVRLTNAELHAKNDKNRNYRGKKSGEPDRNNLMTEWVCKLRVDNFAVLEVDRERSSWRRSSLVDTKANGTENHHSEDIKPCESVIGVRYVQPRQNVDLT